MGTKRTMNVMTAGARARSRPSPGLRMAMTLLIALALAVGFATARAQSPDAAPAVADGWSGYENQPYRVNVWHDRGDDEVYQRGEAVRVHFETNSDAYAVVYRIDAEGSVSILWPRSRFDDGFVFGQHTYNLPTPGAERIRASGAEGVEYVQVIVSAYPFDLRGLEVDFHHESAERDYAYYVAGDPFLAMNDVNFAVTGLEDASDYVVTNYLSYYVHRQVDHPRYMCTQCHDDNSDYHPYEDACVVEIHHDYSWDNDWYHQYSYYPVYYYPVYYYVDPWTWRPWINYWYRPWYNWPSWHYASWGFDCYVWNYSPHWRGDVWTRYKDDSNRRYRPIDKNRYAGVGADADHRHPGAIVKTPRPTRDMVSAMDRREPIRKGDAVRPDRGSVRSPAYSDRDRQVRPVADITRPTRDEHVAPGIRVPSGGGQRAGTSNAAVRPNPLNGRGDREVREPTRLGEGESRQPTRPPAGDDRRNVRPSVKPPAQGEGGRAVRPVKPHSQGSRIWQGGSRDQKPAQTVKPRGGSDKPTRKPEAVKPRSERSPQPTRKAPEAKPRSGGKTPTRKSESVKPRSSGSSKGGSSSSVKPRSSSGSKSSGSSRSSSSSSSSRSKGGGKKNSSRGGGR